MIVHQAGTAVTLVVAVVLAVKTGVPAVLRPGTRTDERVEGWMLTLGSCAVVALLWPIFWVVLAWWACDGRHLDTVRAAARD